MASDSWDNTMELQKVYNGFLSGWQKGNIQWIKNLISGKSLNESVTKSHSQLILNLMVAGIHLDSMNLAFQQKQELQTLLDNYKALFEEPVGLPPRCCDHQILLKSETQLAKAEPYRYPHFQKQEIKKSTTLSPGIIQPRSSPFSAHVLFGRKQDGSWVFCVDYRNLNEAAIKHKFPIPIIEDLLDELRGANCFSKLDLRADYHKIRMNNTNVYKTAFENTSGAIRV